MFKANNAKEPNNNSNLINRIVEGTTITGNIESDNNVRLDGIIIGNITIKGKLVLGEAGKIEGNINCLNADIEGSIKGDINVDGLLTLKETAKIDGTIVTNKIGVLEGAVFTGSIQMSNSSSQNFNADIKLEETEAEEASSEIVY